MYTDILGVNYYWMLCKKNKHRLIDLLTKRLIAQCPIKKLTTIATKHFVHPSFTFFSCSLCISVMIFPLKTSKN